MNAESPEWQRGKFSEFQIRTAVTEFVKLLYDQNPDRSRDELLSNRHRPEVHIRGLIRPISSQSR
jgi:hypothetical protein